MIKDGSRHNIHAGCLLALKPGMLPKAYDCVERYRISTAKRHREFTPKLPNYL
jgi:hypothetical protein